MDIYDVNKNAAMFNGQCRYWRHIHQRKSIRRREERIVFKTGEFNIEKSLINKCALPDLVTVFTEARWRWTISYCILVYVLNWLAFTFIWWIILDVHGDLDLEHLPNENNSNEWKPCVREIYSLKSVFLFSIEIHSTIGYGKRAVTLECVSAMATMCIESITGKICQSFIIGIVFAKLIRPKNRAHTLIFSRNIIVNQRDRELCLIFRVGNLRKSRIIGVTVTAYLIKYETVDGDVLNYDQVELKLEIDSNAAIFAFPITAFHVFNQTSPFYNISAYDMIESKLEILVVIEGTIESTGQIVQAKTSYTNHDILWGRRFANTTFYRRKKRGFIIDFAKFNEMYKINTPVCAARNLHDYYEAREENMYLP